MEDNNNMKNTKICFNSSRTETEHNFNPLSPADSGKNLQIIYVKDSKKEENKSLEQKELKFNLSQKFMAELFGTTILVYECCGAPTFNKDKLYVGVLTSSFAVAFLVYIFVKISGAHFNPAVSLALFMKGVLTLKEFFLYILAQIIGAFIGCIFIALSRKGKFDELGATKIADYLIQVNGGTKIDAWCYISCLFTEIFSTFLLILFVLAIGEKYNQLGINIGLAFGLALIALIFTGANISGSSFNPARSLAPAALQALCGGDTKPIEQIWIYIIGPFSGSIIAFYAWKLFIHY